MKLRTTDNGKVLDNMILPDICEDSQINEMISEFKRLVKYGATLTLNFNGVITTLSK